MMRSDYNRWPGTGASCGGFGECACFDPGGFNGPVNNILVYFSPYAFKANNLRAGTGRGPMGVVAIFVVGAFTEYTYRRRINGKNELRKVETKHIARFWNNGEGQTWLDEEFAKHVQFDHPLGFLQQNKKPFPGPVDYGQIYVGAGALEVTMSRSVAGYPDENFSSSLHKLNVGAPGQELDETAPPAGGTFRSTDWGGRHYGLGFTNNNVVQLAVGSSPATEVGLVGFNKFQVLNSEGAVQQDLNSDGNLHICRWDENSGGFLVGSRREADFPEGQERPREVRLLSANGANVWDMDGGRADANTNFLTSGFYETPQADEKFNAIYWGRALNYSGTGWEWNNATNNADPFQLMRIQRNGSISPSWQGNVTATGNGPILFDIDNEQNVYFGGPVTSINGTPVPSWQVYRLNWNGSEFHQFGTVSGGAGRAYVAKVFSSDFGAPNWGGASQLIIGGDFTHYEPPPSALHPRKVATNYLVTVSITPQGIRPQTHWPAPWKHGGQFQLGDNMPGLGW